MKKASISLLIIAFLSFLGYQYFKTQSYSVLEVISPIEIIVDLNRNGINDDEPISFKNIQSFSTKPSENQSELAKKLNISEEDAIGLGFLAQNFAKDNLAEKQVKIFYPRPLWERARVRGENNPTIYVDNKNYGNLLLNSGLAASENGNINKTKFQENVKKIRSLHLRIFNNKSHKYHQLNCKYGLMAHNAQIMAANQIPKDAKPCKFCLSRTGNRKQETVKRKNEFYKDVIPNIAQAPTILSTGSIKIFLTDLTRVLKPSHKCNTAVCRELIQQVNSAQSSIDFAIYGYTKIPELQQALENAQKRGVKIRFVYDIDNKGENFYTDTLYLTTVLKENQTDFAPPNRKSKTKYQSALMHNKFFIFDDKKVLTGSANISGTDMSGFNSNAIIVINSPQVAQIYEKEFEQMYSGKFHKSKLKIKNSRILVVDNSSLSVYFSPKDKPITTQIIPLIDGAQKYIYMPVFLITHKELADSLVRASKRGVNVKVIIDATNSHGSASKHKYLRQNGIQVKTENFAGKCHSKSIIIDDTYTIIGSMNFSKSGEGINDENLVIIKNSEIAKFYKTFFQYLWKRIPDKWLYKNARAESPDSIGSCSDGIDNDFDGKIDMQDDSCRILGKNKRN